MCLWQNYQAGHSAKLLTNVYGVEGAKTEYELTVVSSGGIDVVRQLEGNVWRFHCQKLERQDNTWGYRIGPADPVHNIQFLCGAVAES